MGALVFLTGAITASMGSYLLLDRSGFEPIIRWISQEGRLLRVSFLRLLLAAGFYYAADQTRLPLITLLLAGVFLLSAIAVPLAGEQRATRMIDWWLERLPLFALPWSLIAMSFGMFLMWLAWPAA